MRLFIAFPLSDAIKDALTAAQDEMYANSVRGNCEKVKVFSNIIIHINKTTSELYLQKPF